MERFFNVRDQKNSKNMRRKGSDQEIKKKTRRKEKNGGKKKERLLGMWRFPYSCTCMSLIIDFVSLSTLGFLSF
jgi:hypothetical protein